MTTSMCSFTLKSFILLDLFCIHFHQTRAIKLRPMTKIHGFCSPPRCKAQLFRGDHCAICNGGLHKPGETPAGSPVNPLKPFPRAGLG